MIGNIEDSLNYHLIMEGFYYDAEIEHITEIIKSNLYFAVLEGENNKILKNTHDTYYFSIDDELVYTNYYFDFGPLNISCLYKYCCNLSNYLQYSQGCRRVVHYTTANPVKRVNAAFLMGCYAVIYLKMDPKDIHRLLLSTGGQFKSFVDASQGYSQYTINLMDCLHAIQKALAFNFFNFADFNVKEYDLYDKLQNGDMNWLLPRKFLAFIGPTDNELMNGHPPDFYIKYFLENDIKTVVRLNNKVYDSSVFTQVGIEHHELFFPDGTIPTKQILLRFLDLSETARAAIAVHCKAGLGRTGSLIGAYIVKHYRMTAREAIAWMRICRPGSVIGQQQGWLEKIEAWLWRQGNVYRLEHFGEGDKIPHHKYGIYSGEWPKQREKLIRHIQRRRYETQSNCGWVKLEAEPLARPISTISHLDCPVHNCVPAKKSLSRGHTIMQKPTQSVMKEEGCRKVSKTFGKMQRSAQAGNRTPKTVSKSRELYRVQDVDSSSEPYQEESGPKSKQQQFSPKCKERRNFELDAQMNSLNELTQKRYVTTAPSYYDTYQAEIKDKLGSSNNFHESRTPPPRLRKRNQSENRDLLVENRPSIRLRKSFVQNLEQTQGDKLNDIKARRFASYVEGEGSTNKLRQLKPRRRYPTSTNMDVGGKPASSTTTKKQQMEMLHPLKRSHLEHIYAPRT